MITLHFVYPNLDSLTLAFCMLRMYYLLNHQKLSGIHPFISWVFQFVSPKDKGILLHNHALVIKFRTFKIDIVFILQSMFKLCQMS